MRRLLSVGIAYGGLETLNIGLGSGTDTFAIISVHEGTTTLNGNAGSDTLIGPDVSNTWSVTHINAGDVNGNFLFSGVENLTGGMDTDAFVFLDGTVLAGFIGGAPTVSGDAVVDALGFHGLLLDVTQVATDFGFVVQEAQVAVLEALVDASPDKKPKKDALIHTRTMAMTTMDRFQMAT